MLQKVIDYCRATYRNLTARKGVPVYVYPAAQDRLQQREAQQLLSVLTPQMAVELYSNYRAGKYATLQLMFEQLEEQDETLRTVVDSRQGALAEMPWRVSIDAEAVGDDPALQAVAEAQQEYLNRLLGNVANLDEALEHLGMADFRGYAALEITGTDRRMTWNVIEPWNLSRPCRRGPWLYNPEADDSLTQLEELDMDAVIIREVKRPIDICAMFIIVGKGHSMNAWDAYLDTYGVPSIFFELPPGTSKKDSAEWEKVVQRILAEGRGILPAGTNIHTVETTQNSSDAYATRTKEARDSIITAALGGLLTVTTEAGSGTLAGNAHTDSLSRLCARTAAGISACINTQFCRPRLSVAFPGQPVLAYFDLSAVEEEDAQAKAALIATYAGIGFYPDEAAASEAAGMELHREQPPAAMGSPMFNREQEADEPLPQEPDLSLRTAGEPGRLAAATEPPAALDTADTTPEQESNAPLTAAETALIQRLATSTTMDLQPLATAYEKDLTAALLDGLGIKTPENAPESPDTPTDRETPANA